MCEAKRVTNLSGEKQVRTMLLVQRNPVRTIGYNNGHIWRSLNAAAFLGDHPEKKKLYCGQEKCDKIAFYQVMREGFCEGHKAEAYAAQAVYWVKKMGKVA